MWGTHVEPSVAQADEWIQLRSASMRLGKQGTGKAGRKIVFSLADRTLAKIEKLITFYPVKLWRAIGVKTVAGESGGMWKCIRL